MEQMVDHHQVQVLEVVLVELILAVVVVQQETSNQLEVLVVQV
jgi:hypothetical protein